MQSIFRQILKQNNKITRIVTRISQQHPQLASSIDLALYACLKIQKTINKFINEMSPQQHMQLTVPEQLQFNKITHLDESLLQTALENIEQFKNSAYKLERKINIVINQNQNRGWRKKTYQNSKEITKEHKKQIGKQQQNKQILQQQLSRQILKQQGRPKKGSLRQKQSNKGKSHNIEQNSELSRNLSELDDSILKLTEKIQKVQNGQSSASLYQQQQSELNIG